MKKKETPAPPPKKKAVRGKTLESGIQHPNRHDKNYRFKHRDVPASAYDVRSTVEMIAFLESDAGKSVLVESRLIATDGEQVGYRRLGRNKFIDTFKENAKIKTTAKFMHAFKESFDTGGVSNGNNFSGNGYLNTVGNDFTPLLGGPFYKQLYYYNDWLQMHQDCFFAYHHDPYGKATVNILVDFTLGKGFQVQCENEVAQALWEAFEKANDFQNQFRNLARELSAYGEHMLWWLPDNEKYIIYPNDEINLKDVPKAFIPRLRLIDPSNIVEIVTYPEDITRRLFYVWLTPTQYQTYTAKDPATGKVVNSTKLIYQQIPAKEIMHYTINAVSNEKRGRSDLFAALPYFKRLRDSVNYEIIAQQKNAAWAIDTTIAGDENDISNYIADQQALSTIAPAGSEFVHTAAIKREYLGNSSTGKSVSSAFEWTLSMIAACTGIPISYYGTHLSGGSTRASAIVATEPVAKRFEMRQEVYKGIVRDVFNRLMDHFGIKNRSMEVIFPEIITQDRSAKLKDLYMAETSKWISNERAAETAAKEFGFNDYDWETEKEKMALAASNSIMIPSNPLTAPGAVQKKPSAIGSDEKKKIKDYDGA